VVDESTARREETPSARRPARPESGGRFVVGAWIVFSFVALGLYWQALRGPFISDDVLYIVINPWTDELSLEKLAGIFSPTGEARLNVANYAPLTLLANAIERAVFWDDTLGYHVVNVLLHGLNAALFATLLIRTGLSRSLSLVGALFFLAHPATVEAVAWISQLKTLGALACTLGALLAFPRHPAWSTLLFTVGLLVKAAAAAALPAAAALAWCRRADLDRPSSAWRWIAMWGVIFAVYTIPQYTAIHPRGTVVIAAYEDFAVHLRTIASIGTHYLSTAYFAYGVSHAKEHAAVLSWLDPWWLASLPLAAFFVWRMVVSITRRSIESLYWVMAAASFVPISQLLPFSHPIADRYLYLILPGLIGGTLLALQPAIDRWSASGRIRGVGVIATCVVLLVFSLITMQRAHLWTDQILLSLDSARNFPAGRTALALEARHHAQRRDVPRSVDRLRRAAALGRSQFQALVLDENLAPIAHSPEFRELVSELAGRYIDSIHSHGRPTTGELGALSRAHFERGEYGQAVQRLEQAVARGNLVSRLLVEELAELHALLADLESGSAATRASRSDTLWP